MAGIAIKDQVDLISTMIPLEVAAHNNKQQNFMCFWLHVSVIVVRKEIQVKFARQLHPILQVLKGLSAENLPYSWERNDPSSRVNY